MEEALSPTHHRWSYELLKNGVCIAPEYVGSSFEMGNEQEVLIRVQGRRVSLLVYDQPVKFAPYLVCASPNIVGDIPVSVYKGATAGYYFGIYCCDADTDIDLIDRDGTAWRGICNYVPEWE
jgi:hypothetical protein